MNASIRSVPSRAKSRSPSKLCGPSSTPNCMSDIWNPPVAGGYSHRQAIANCASRRSRSASETVLQLLKFTGFVEAGPDLNSSSCALAHVPAEIEHPDEVSAFRATLDG